MSGNTPDRVSSPSAQPAGEPLRLLIVEDSPADVELYLWELRRSGFAPTAAVVTSAREFCAQLQGAEFDLILSDYHLPGWDALGVLRSLRDCGSDLPLVLVTGLLGDEKAVECVKAGAVDYVLKDHLSRLPIAVRGAVAEWRLRRERARGERERQALLERERGARTRAEAAEQRYRDLVECLDAIVWEATPAVKLAYISAHGEALLGYPLRHWFDAGRFWWEAVPEPERRTVESRWEAWLERVSGGETGDADAVLPHPLEIESGDRISLEHPMLRADGQRIWVRNLVRAVRDAQGRLAALRGVMIDSTAAVLGRQALVESEGRYRDLFESANDMVFTCDLSGTITSLNRAGERLLGVSRGQIQGTPLSDLVAESDRDEARTMLHRVPLSGGRYEWTVQGAGQQPVTLEFSTAVLYRENRAVAIQGVARDITERRLWEEQKRQLQRMEAIGRLAGGVAHDFNNLLTIINGRAELLCYSLPAESEALAHAREIAEAGERAAALTRQLLTFGGQKPAAPVAVSLEDIVAGMKGMLQRLIGEDISIRIEISSALSAVLAEPAQMEQLLLNLALNARDAMPQGGQLLISLGNVNVEKPLAAGLQAGPHVRLVVSDTGGGMSPEVQTRIFEPFFTTKDHRKGTGLGLSTVYGIVQQRGGAIVVRSRPGAGSSFYIYLPAFFNDQVAAS